MTATLPVALFAWMLLQVSPESLRLQELIRRGEWQAALDMGETVLGARPGDPHARYLLGVAKWRSSDKVGAIQAFRAAERLGLDTSYLHLALGLAYYEANQFVLFQLQMRRAMAIAPSDARPHIHLGRYFESVASDFATALSHFDEALELDPANAEILYLRAHCLEALHRTDHALEVYAQAAAAGSPRASLGMARILNASDPEEALEWATRAVRANADSAESRFVRARILFGLRRREEALQEVELAIAADPDHPEAHFLLSRLLRLAGRHAEAGRILHKFEELRAVYGDL